MASLGPVSEGSDELASVSDSEVNRLLRRSDDVFKSETVHRADAPSGAAPVSASVTKSKLKSETREKPVKSELKSRSDLLASRVRSGEATAEEKAEFKELVTSMKTVVKEDALATSKRREELKSMKDELEKKEDDAVERRKRELEEIMMVIEQAEAVDLCFLLDCTGSMGPYMNAVKQHIKDIVKVVRRAHPLLQLRISFVGYRDPLEPGGGENVALDFVDVLSAQMPALSTAELLRKSDAASGGSSALATFQNFVDKQLASGGGDGCEDVAGGFSKALGLTWKNQTKLLFHIADAPCHGGEFNGGFNDNHAASDHGIVEHLKTLKTSNIEYYFAKLNNSTDAMIRAFNKTLSPDGLGTDYIRSAEMSDPKEIIALVSGSVTKSISHSATRLASSKRIDPSKVRDSLSLRRG